MDKQKSQKKLSLSSFVNTNEGLSFSDYFDDSVPYEQKPPEMIRPMQEDDYPIQTKSQEGGLSELTDISNTVYNQLWLDQDGEFHETRDHAVWVRNWFHRHGLKIPENETSYMAAFKRGFIRVIKSSSTNTLHFQYGDRGGILTKPNHKQISALKDAAIELGWNLFDDVDNSEMELCESMMLEDIVKISNDYWMDPNGKLFRCPFGHTAWARAFLMSKAIRFDPESESLNIYDAMFEFQFLRIKVSMDKRIYFEYGSENPPNNRQLRNLRDTAIESHFKLIDATGQYKELDLLQEYGNPEPFDPTHSEYWMDPDGKWYAVEREGHAGFAAHHLSQQKIYVKSHAEYYQNMYKLGWIRIYVQESTLCYDTSREPNNVQWRSLRDVASEYKLDLWDDTNHRTIELQEGKGGKNLFIESMMPADTETFKSNLAQLFAYLQKELQLKSVPKVKLVSDEKNAGKVLGKTAYYDPENKLVVLYTTNRHQKDILRSFAHEVIHHWQHENEKLGAGKNEVKGSEQDPQYAQHDPWMRQMEKQAYLLGNIIFRDWEDQKKAQDLKSQKTVAA